MAIQSQILQRFHVELAEVSGFTSGAIRSGRSAIQSSTGCKTVPWRQEVSLNYQEPH